MADTYIGRQRCPYCRKEATVASPVMPGIPAPGDVSVCYECGKMAVFDRNMRLTLPTAKDAERLSPADRALIDKTQASIRASKCDVLITMPQHEGVRLALSMIKERRSEPSSVIFLKKDPVGKN